MNQSRSKLLRMWLDLLRSGHYSQAQEVLSDGTGFCCLGVVADGVFNVEWIEDEHNDTKQLNYRMLVDGEELIACDNELISMHSEALGLTRTEDDKATQQMLNGVASHIKGEPVNLFDDSNMSMREYLLIRLNDKYSFTFNQIADFIEMSGWITEAEQEESEATLKEEV